MAKEERIEKRVVACWATPCSWSNEIHYCVNAYSGEEPPDMGMEGWVLVGTSSIQFGIPDERELRPKLAQAMQRKLREMRGKHHQEETELEEQIQSMLALEAPRKADDDLPF